MGETKAQPSALTASFRVVRLTREALKEQCKADDFEQWGAPALSRVQYQEKERRQRETAFSRGGSIFWAIVQRRDGHGGDQGDDDSDTELVPGEDLIVCHCESHRFDCALRSREGHVLRGHSYHIASVFTLPAFRKRGLAAFFLSEVARRMCALPDALLSVLYSDIGPTFYDRLGWRLYPSTIATLAVGHPRNATVATTTTEAEALFLDERLDELLASDNARLVDQLRSGQYDGQQAFAVLPTRDSVEWQFCVGITFARVRGLAELPTQCGVRLEDADAFMVWCHNLKESALYIVRTRFQDSTAAVQLLEAALREARKFDLQKVCIWDPSLALRAADVASRVEIAFGEREDSLSSAMVFGSDAGSTEPLPVWLANEKCAWV
jgi:GNAT superfamily N-acetyltransferase